MEMLVPVLINVSLPFVVFHAVIGVDGYWNCRTCLDGLSGLEGKLNSRPHFRRNSKRLWSHFVTGLYGRCHLLRSQHCASIHLRLPTHHNPNIRTQYGLTHLLAPPNLLICDLVIAGSECPRPTSNSPTLRSCSRRPHKLFVRV